MSASDSADEVTYIPPDHFICPITYEVMQDPVIWADGITYERSAITEWLETQSKGPTGARLPIFLIPNGALESAINEMKREHPNWETMDDEREVKRRKVETSATAITLHIKTLIGTTITIKADKKDSVRKLKVRLFKVSNIRPDFMRLIYHRKQFEDRKTLREYNLCDQSTVHLVLRLLGC